MRSAKDRKKIIQRGITILRVREEQLSIWHLDSVEGSWKQLRKFATKSALEKEIKRIDNEKPYHIFE